MEEKINIRYSSEGVWINLPYSMLEDETVKDFFKYCKLESFIRELNLSEKVIKEMIEESNERIRSQIIEEFKNAKTGC
jgi:hypothetical protein